MLHILKSAPIILGFKSYLFFVYMYTRASDVHKKISTFLTFLKFELKAYEEGRYKKTKKAYVPFDTITFPLEFACTTRQPF